MDGSSPGDPDARVLVLGASSQIGWFLLPRLLRAGLQPVPVGRAARPHAAGPAASSLPHARAAICLAPLDALPPLLPGLHHCGVQRLIAFSTTGRFYKTVSADDAERRRLAQLIAAEEAIAELGERHHIVWTLFRPTLVYGCGRDRNVTAIARFVRRFGFFPLVDMGRGLRQPVHADDLAEACVAALDRTATFGKAYTLSGGSVVTYREMVEAVFRQLGRAPRIVEVPLPVLRAAIAAARWVPGLRSLSPEMASRMRMDLCFDHAQAARDFGFRPRPFQLDDTALGRA